MERIGRYEITGELGRGGMGIVYQAKDPAIGRTVAIKTIRLDTISDPGELRQMKDRLMREARSAGLMSHTSIVTIYDVGQEGNMAYIAMEFVHGLTLEQLLRQQGPLPGPQLIQILRETAEALDHAHAQGIVHRDVKPANIMISNTGTVKITDFGIAKIASQNMTQANTILGTPSFMSPEQIEGKPVDGRSDQFALAVIAYELLTGEKPFVGDTLPGLLYQIVKQEPASPHLLNASLREPVSRVIAQAMDKNPEQRFLKCTAFVRALESALNDSAGWRPIPHGVAATQETMAASASLAAAPSTASKLPPPRRRPHDESSQQTRRRWPVIVAVASVLAVASAGYLYYLNRPYIAAPQTDPAAEPPVVAAAPNAADKPSPMLPPPNSAAPPSTPVEAQKGGDQPEETKAATKPPAPRTTPPSKVPPGSTILDIITIPGGATVSVDSGKSSCVTPCPQSLDNGRHTLAFSLAGYRDTARIVNLPQETTVNVSLLRAEGTLMIRSTPAGATILVDDKARAEKTPTTLTLPAGQHKLTLRRDGSPEYSETIEVKDQVITNVNVNW
ncbi:MAG: serine/threonine-protein kinase [Acidobacteriota bacterium]